jgi:hypothetical protein
MNGESVVECAMFQLPTMIMDKRSGWYSYFTLLYNVYNSDLNMGVDGEVYPELIAQNFPEKVAEKLK